MPESEIWVNQEQCCWKPTMSPDPICVIPFHFLQKPSSLAPQDLCAPLRSALIFTTLLPRDSASIHDSHPHKSLLQWLKNLHPCICIHLSKLSCKKKNVSETIPHPLHSLNMAFKVAVQHLKEHGKELGFSLKGSRFWKKYFFLKGRKEKKTQPLWHLRYYYRYPLTWVKKCNNLDENVSTLPSVM